MFDPLRLQIYAAVAIGLVMSHGYVAVRSYTAGDKTGHERCDRANRDATRRLNDRIRALNSELAAERQRLISEREERLAAALAADSGKACEYDEAFRNRLNGLLK